jgi:hypothetical protein
MNAAQIRAMYKSFCQMTITVRRYSGPATARTWADVTARGNARLFGGKELIGTIAQGDQQVIILVDDLVANGFQLPIVVADKIVLGGRERQILAPIGERKALDGTLIAYELQARG